MAFDKDSTLPLIQPQKRTTKVNFAVVIGVLAFLAICAGVVVWLDRSTPDRIPAAETKTP